MSFYDDLQREADKTTEDTDLLGLRYDEFMAALNAKDWDKATELRPRIVELNNSILNSTMVGFMLVDIIERNLQDGQ